MKKRMTGLLTTVALLLALVLTMVSPALALGTDDGYTAYNLKWLEGGKLSFDAMYPSLEHGYPRYYIMLYTPEGRYINEVSTQGIPSTVNADGSETCVIDFSSDMVKGQTYLADVQFWEMSDLGSEHGKNGSPRGEKATSPKLTFGTTPVTPPTPAAPMAYMRTQSITIDGKAVSFQAYALKDDKGNETNYVKLRDVAMQLNGTSVQFNVGWSGAVNIETGKAYVSNGTEMQTPFSGDRAYTDSAAPTNVNGAASTLAAIVLNDDKGAGYTYYKLRDLGTALGFKVDWSAAKGITVDTGAAAPAGDIETPAVTDASLTAPTGVKLTIGTEEVYNADGTPKTIPAAVPSVVWSNTAGARADGWNVCLYDEKNQQIRSNYLQLQEGEAPHFDINEVKAGTVAAITITPIDTGADGFVASEDDKTGVTTIFRCSIQISAKTGTPMTATAKPTTGQSGRTSISITPKPAPHTYGYFTCSYLTSSGNAAFLGHALTAYSDGTLQVSEQTEWYESRYAAQGTVLTLTIFSDTAVQSDTTASYTATVHPVTLQK